jgi:DNA-binding MarR family transcriptional regulator
MAMKAERSNFGYTIADMTRLLRRVFDRRAAQLGLTRAQWRALKLVGKNPGLTQVQLAEELDMEPIAVGRVLDRMQLAGFIERRNDPNDRRCWRLYPVGETPAAMVEMKRIADQLNDEVLEGVSDEDFETVMRVLAAVKVNLHELDRERPAPVEKKKKEEVK